MRFEYSWYPQKASGCYGQRWGSARQSAVDSRKRLWPSFGIFSPSLADGFRLSEHGRKSLQINLLTCLARLSKI